MKYNIERPPLSKNFYLPPQEVLHKLKPDDLVKIMFRGPDVGVERMWVKITKQQDISEWTGELDNDPRGEELGEILKAGDQIIFHPLDIIQIWEGKNQDNE